MLCISIFFVFQQKTPFDMRIRYWSSVLCSPDLHHAGHIGVLGVDRKGVENFQLSLGGSGAEDASVGQITGPGFSEDGVVDAIEKVTNLYLEQREEDRKIVA